MDRSRRAGVSSPQQGHVRAGIAGDEPMVMLRGRLMRIGFILGLLLMLTSAASIDPQAAIARPAPTDGVEGTPTGNGDPQADHPVDPVRADRVRNSGAGNSLERPRQHLDPPRHSLRGAKERANRERGNTPLP